MIKSALIFLISLNLIGCTIKTNISDVSHYHSNQKLRTSYAGNYLTANYSMKKGDAYTVSKILDKNLRIAPQPKRPISSRTVTPTLFCNSFSPTFWAAY